MKKWFFVTIIFTVCFFGVFGSRFFSVKTALAAGGPCPTAAEYTNPSNPTGPYVTLASLGITNCYYIAANGNDTNSGTSESTPWLHSPGMENCSGNCASVSLTPGTGVIFHGGDTWHFGNPSASPYAGVVSTCADNGNNAAGLCLDDINGTNAHPIYYGVDSGWYAGASWTRPILTADNSLCNSGTTGTMPDGATCTSNPSNACNPDSGSACTGLYYVSSCPYQIGNTNNLVDAGFSEYISIDNFELTGLCQNHIGQPSGFDVYVDYGAVNAPITLTNLYIHGWSHTQWGAPNGQPPCHGVPESCVNVEAFAGGPITAGAPADSDFFNVVDGSDSDPIGIWMFSGFYNAAYNVFRYFSGSEPGDLHVFHDNLMEYYYENGHSNLIESADRGTTNAIYNNVFRHIDNTTAQGVGGVGLWLGPVTSADTDYIFNNVMYDVGDIEYLNLGGTGLTSDLGNYIYFNNTWQTDYAQTILRCEVVTSPATIVDTNNHYITDDSTYILGPCGTLTTTTPLLQTNAAAAAAGYTTVEIYGYSPTSASSPTVAAGTNEMAYCNTLLASTDPLIQAAGVACKSGTTYACTYNTSNHTVSCPTQTPIARPTSGAWDVGAYQYSSSGGGSTPGTPTIPAGLSVSGTTTSTVSLSWSASSEQGGTGSISGYYVYRNGSQVGSTANTSYTNTGLTASTTYSYTVAAYDTNGNVSSQSGSVNATTQANSSDTTPPTISISSPANNATVSGTITISGTASDNVSVSSVAVSIDGGAYQSAQGTTSWTYSLNTTSLTNGPHTIVAKATDPSSNVGTSPTVTVTVNNTGGGGGGGIITQVGTASAVSNGAGTMTATFGTPTNAGELVTVAVMTNENGNVPTAVTDNKGDTYTEAYETAGIYDHFSNGLYYLANAPAGITTITITENADDLFGGAIAAHYSGVATTNPLDVFSTPSMTGALSPWASGAITTSQANELLVGGVSARVSSGAVNCTLAASGNWTQDASIANSNDLDGANGSAMAYAHQIVSSIQTNIADTGTNPAGTCANYAGIAAFKAASSGGTSSTPGTPTIPAGLSVSGTTTSTVSLSWSASSEQGGTGSISGYYVYRNGSQVGSTANTSYTNTGLTASTTYSYTVAAYDTNGNVSSQSGSVNATTQAAPDTTPPTVPTGLTTTNITTSSVSLSWTASTDPTVSGQVTSGLAGYKIYRGGTQIGTSATNSFTNTGLTASTTYAYTVSAYDNAGNASAQSTAINATTGSPADTTPPTTSITAPANNATVSGVITVTASASDNVGVVKVELYLDGSLQATDSASPYTFPLNTVLLANGSHTLITKAYDAAGNVGTSPTVTVTVSNAPETLSASLSASLTTGVAPLTTSLTAGATGTAEGTLNYIFYCNRSDTGTNVTAPADLTVNAATTSSYTATNLCSYETAGTYTAKVIIEEGTAPPAEAQQVIVVSSQATTTPSLISSVTVGQITDTGAQVTIVTTASASLQVNYGTTTGYGNTTAPSPDLTTTYVNLANLTQSTTYHFDVVATPVSGSPATSQDFSFTTQATPSSGGGGGGGGGGGSSGGGGGSSGGGGGGGGSLGGGTAYLFTVKATVTTSTETTAKITVANSVPALTQLFYGTSLAYGSTTVQSPLLTTSYFALGNLTPGTTYDLKAVSLAEGTTFSSPNITFTPGTAVTPPSSSLPPFTRNLTVGSTGSDVMELQELLNQWGYTITASGPGSPGHETTYFGGLTAKAVQKLQAADAIAPVSGFVGPLTRTKLNELIGASASTPAPTTPSGAITTNLAPGDSGSPVSTLQGILVKDGDLAPQYVTGYYGSLTEAAVERFQATYGIISYGSPATTGYGAVGPKTRAALGE